MLRSDFRALIFLRVPISALALVGLEILVHAYSTIEIATCVYLGLLVYLGVVSVQLFRLRPGALPYAWVLVLLEAVGAVLWVGLRDLRLGQHLGALAILGCIVVVVWGLLNALLFYKARAVRQRRGAEEVGFISRFHTLDRLERLGNEVKAGPGLPFLANGLICGANQRPR